MPRRQQVASRPCSAAFWQEGFGRVCRFKSGSGDSRFLPDIWRRAAPYSTQPLQIGRRRKGDADLCGNHRGRVGAESLDRVLPAALEFANA